MEAIESESYQIVPWDHLMTAPETEGKPAVGTVLEQYVPPELEALAWKVMEQYDMRVSQMVLITSKPDKGGAIWRIDTDKGPRSIKVLHRTPQRSLFSIGAQQYLVEQGARVPALIPTIDDQLYVEAGGKAWIVTDWIDTLIQASKIDLEGASALCQGLGEFHLWSKNYVPPHGAAKSSRLYNWPKHYQKILTKIGWFRDIAEAYPETAGSAPLLQVIDEFEQQAREMLDRLQNSAYSSMVAMGESYWGLAHQDYGWSNGQMGPGGIWVIDLDGVAYDLPFRDLRKLMTSTMDDMGVWDITWIRGMIEAYNRGNPLDQEMFDLLWIDMAFPNEFYKHVKEMVFDPVNFMNLELAPILQRVLTTESTKWQVLQELLNDRDKYPPGDYMPQHEPLPWDIEVPDSELISAGKQGLERVSEESFDPEQPSRNDDPPPPLVSQEVIAPDLPQPGPAFFPLLTLPRIAPARRAARRRKRRKLRPRFSVAVRKRIRGTAKKKPKRRAAGNTTRFVKTARKANGRLAIRKRLAARRSALSARRSRSRRKMA
ncbi:CotS family spore coat protein [Paenibacillus marinisediminis]